MNERLRQGVRRGARDDGDARSSTCPASERFGTRRAAEGERRRRGRGAARVQRDQEQRPRRADPLHRRVESFVPPKKGEKHVMRVVREILDARARGHAAPNLTLRARLCSGKVARRRVVAFLISDFLADGYERALRDRAAQPRPDPGKLVDPREEELPDVGLVLFEDLETGEVVEVDTASKRCAERLRDGRSQGSGAAPSSSSGAADRPRRRSTPIGDYVQPIADLFRMRQRRLKGYDDAPRAALLAWSRCSGSRPAVADRTPRRRRWKPLRAYRRQTKRFRLEHVPPMSIAVAPRSDRRHLRPAVHDRPLTASAKEGDDVAVTRSRTSSFARSRRSETRRSSTTSARRATSASSSSSSFARARRRAGPRAANRSVRASRVGRCARRTSVESRRAATRS